MTRRIAIVTGSRAEYGLLKSVIAGVAQDPVLELQLIATAAHLSPEFGETWREIAADGFDIAERVEILLSSDTGTGTAKAMGLGLIGFADAFARLRPDIVVLLGDRFEILSAAAAALVARIPIAHIHGGETTEGAFDEAIRHAVTKMAHLHFVAAAPYRDRVIQLGENPAHVFLAGSPGIDAIKSLALLDRNALEAALDFRFGARNLLVTFHPATLDAGDASTQMDALLGALDAVEPATHLLFTLPNADPGGRAITGRIREYIEKRPNARAYESLGQLRFLSCLAQVDGMVGNSSSGIIEAPSFDIGTINIGDRQKGRLRASSIIDCAPEREAIESALRTLASPEFISGLRNVVNPYDNGASATIVTTLRDHPLEGLMHKVFHDIEKDRNG